MVFVPSRGFLFFYSERLRVVANSTSCFRPLTGISLFLYRQGGERIWIPWFSSPHGDFSFSIEVLRLFISALSVFVPSRGFLFFYEQLRHTRESGTCRFRPLTGISLFLFIASRQVIPMVVFVPSRGFLFFYGGEPYRAEIAQSFRPLTGISLFLLLHRKLLTPLLLFSSPHGDFSFSMFGVEVVQFQYLFSSPHGDFSFSISQAGDGSPKPDESFRPLTGISLFLLSENGTMKE